MNLTSDPHAWPSVLRRAQVRSRVLAARRWSSHARPIVSQLLVERVTFRPLETRGRWEMTGEGTLAGLFAGSVISAGMASPTGFANMWKRKLAGILRRPPRWSRLRMACGPAAVGDSRTPLSPTDPYGFPIFTQIIFTSRPCESCSRSILGSLSSALHR
jgi:hypothetical protein